MVEDNLIKVSNSKGLILAVTYLDDLGYSTKDDTGNFTKEYAAIYNYGDAILYSNPYMCGNRLWVKINKVPDGKNLEKVLGEITDILNN